MPVPSDRRRQFTDPRPRERQWRVGQEGAKAGANEWTREEKGEEEEPAKPQPAKPQPAKPPPQPAPSKFAEAVQDAAERRAEEQAAEEKRKLEKAKREKEEEAQYGSESDDTGDESAEESEQSTKDGSSSDDDGSDDDDSEEEENTHRRKLGRLMAPSTRIAAGFPINKSDPKTPTEDEEWERKEKKRADAVQAAIRAAAKAARETERKERDAEDVAVEDDVDYADPQPGSENYEKELKEALRCWRHREEERVDRDRQAMLAPEKELEEIDRRRNMAPDKRADEDALKLSKEKEERESRRSMASGQQNLNFGPHYEEELQSAGLAGRNLKGVRIQDSTDRSLLPKFKQNRNPDKDGLRSQQRHKNLADEDTGVFGEKIGGNDGRRKKDDNRRAPDDRTKDDRFKSDGDSKLDFIGRRRDGRWGGGDERGATGPNARPLGERRKRPVDDRDWKHREDKRPRRL